MPNNIGNPTDSSGANAIDFVWGNLPLQPNDERAATATQTGGLVTYPITAASASSGVVTYTSTNSLSVGQEINITGLTNGKFNLGNVVVASATTSQFTVRSAAANGESSLSTQTGIVTLVTGADRSWSQTTKVASARLNPALDNHSIAEADWSGYPSYTPAVGNFIVTAASGNGTTVTYTSQNKLAVGDVVNVTGLTVGAFNLSSATVATANSVSFTVTNAAGSGVTITGQTGKVEATNALTAYDGAGEGNILVPNVLGLTTANALDALQDQGFELANITNTTGVTNTATQLTRINVTSTTAATVYVTGGTGTWPVGTKVTIAAGTGVPTALVGTWSITGGSGSTLVIAGSGWTVADTGAITPGTVLTGASGTVKTQSQAANASVATTGTITITSWA